MEKILELLQQWKVDDELITIVIDEGNGKVFSLRGRIKSFDADHLEFETFNNHCLIKLDHIVKMKVEK